MLPDKIILTDNIAASIVDFLYWNEGAVSKSQTEVILNDKLIVFKPVRLSSILGYDANKVRIDYKHTNMPSESNKRLYEIEDILRRSRR
jgi:hypothetical protein